MASTSAPPTGPKAGPAPESDAPPEPDTLPEISTRLVSVFFHYFEHLYGRERTLRALARIGNLPLDYIVHPGNFVSLGYCIRVARVLTEDSGDPGFLRKAGIYQFATPKLWGFLYYAARSLGSPQLYFRFATKWGSNFNRVGEVSIEGLTGTRVRSRYHSLKPEMTRQMCEGRMGQMAAVPTLWGLPPADVREIECQIEGADACLYDVTWVASFRPLLRALVGAAIGALVGAAVSGLLPATWAGGSGGVPGGEMQIGAWWVGALFGGVVGTLVALTLGYRAQWQRGARHAFDIAEASQKSVDEFRQRFEEVQRLQRETESARQSLLAEMQRRERAETALVEAQKLEAAGQLAGGIAHDFNNILTVIINYADVVKARARDPELVTSSAHAISAAARRAAQLTRQLLAFGRRQIVHPRVLSVVRHLEEMHEMVSRLVGEGVKVEIAPSGASLHVLIDPGQLEQVVLNLVVNARDAMPSGGALRFETSEVTLAGGDHDLPDGRYVLLAVSDTGHGMDEGTRKHIFEPFFTTKEVGRGSGLGLASCHGIVTQAGGAIVATSAPAKGTTFRIYLPRVDASSDETAESRGAAVARGSETVLLVEDDAQIREVAARELRDAGYRVLEAGEGDQAIAVARAEPGEIHLLVTDVVMPGIDGHALATRLRALRPTMRVLFVSGYPNDVLARHGIALSKIRLLAKPFAIADLTREMRAALAAPPVEVTVTHPERPSGP